MNISKEELPDLCKEMSQVQLLMSIHLNDNEITRNSELMEELLDIFGIQRDDLIELNRPL